MPRQNEAEFIRKVLQDNEDAISFCTILFYISQIWDDFVDGDKPISMEDRLFCFKALLVDIPRNPFYQQCFFELIPLFDASITDWMASNRLRMGNERDRQVAYVLRDRVSIILTYCAGVVGGSDWKAEVAPLIHRHVFEEPYHHFRQETQGQQPQLGRMQEQFTGQQPMSVPSVYVPPEEQHKIQQYAAPTPHPHARPQAQPFTEQPPPQAQPFTAPVYTQPQSPRQPQQPYPGNGYDPAAQPETVAGYTNYRAIPPMSDHARHILNQRIGGIDTSSNPNEAGQDMSMIRGMPLTTQSL